jgi:hypothetical protein
VTYQNKGMNSDDNPNASLAAAEHGGMSISGQNSFQTLGNQRSATHL